MGSGYAEAPASWNVRYRTPDGFDAMLTLRGESGAELLPKTAVAIEWLLEHGCVPNGGHPTDGNGKAGDGSHPGNGSSDSAWCFTHETPMKRREKDGQVWYSHKLPDGSWCRGK